MNSLDMVTPFGFYSKEQFEKRLVERSDMEKGLGTLIVSNDNDILNPFKGIWVAVQFQEALVLGVYQGETLDNWRLFSPGSVSINENEPITWKDHPIYIRGELRVISPASRGRLEAYGKEFSKVATLGRFYITQLDTPAPTQENNLPK